VRARNWRRGETGSGEFEQSGSTARVMSFIPW
jgi:hypothetical protein